MLQPSKNSILTAKDAKATSPNAAPPKVRIGRHLRAAKRRQLKALTQLENAARLVEQLPARGETLHLICNGNFASWDLVPAILKLTGARITRLDVATLGFSKGNVADMAALMDSGKITELWLVYSCYFNSTSPAETELLLETMRDRRARIAAFRNHAKLLLIELETGEHYTVETSANLRSCGNIEQYSLTNSKPLLQFHRAWIENAIKEVETTGPKR